MERVIEKITVSRTYNLGNYESCRLEAEVSVEPKEVDDSDGINEDYRRSFVALDRAFFAIFNNTKKNNNYGREKI